MFLFLEYTFYVGVVCLILGILLWIVQILATRLFRASSERVWTLRIWPASLLAIGLIGLTLPAAITRLAPVSLGKHEAIVNGEQHVTLTGWDQTDYSPLAGMPDVVVLQMANPDVTDDTLGYLNRMSQLRELDVAGAQVTDQGLRSLKSMSKLEKLILSRTQITDKGLAELLEKLPVLKQLDVRETSVTAETLRRWVKGKEGRRCLPRVPIEEPPPVPSESNSR